jgi:hypothetical protein
MPDIDDMNGTKEEGGAAMLMAVGYFLFYFLHFGLISIVPLALIMTGAYCLGVEVGKNRESKRKAKA